METQLEIVSPHVETPTKRADTLAISDDFRQQAASAPDRDKLIKLSESVRAIEVPKISSAVVSAIVRLAINQLADSIKTAADSL